ncbi:MAG: aminoacetone oxidase family FAD-binding enzyme [Bacilli bacterium]|nr:aminoacetone oxidase family FAD-binding enzyme [Bacilli bacterium]
MKIGIIGGGASGLVAAITAKTKDNEVILFERNKEVGKKILATGNGKCNYWNAEQYPINYETSNKEQLTAIINSKTEEKVLSFFKELGILPKIKNGYYYPNSNQALTIRNALEAEAKDKNITIKNNYFVERISKEKNQFVINNEIRVDKLIIATGGYAAPKTGSTGMGYEFAKQFGHTIRKPLPSLVQLVTKKEWYLKEWKGIRTDVAVSQIEVDSNRSIRTIRTELGEIQLTDYGISGICVFNLSNGIARGLDEGKKESVEIDFLPSVEESELRKILNTDKDIRRVLNGLLNEKLVNILLEFGTDKSELIERMKHFQVQIIGTKGFDDAQVTSGGVLLEEINLNTMESLKEKGLYLIGELIDLTGDCGGYNLGICFRTAIIAGESIRGEKDA